ncbi:hypothetical protein Drorol1_Dr00019372 [Drosera rotundifolia]
MDRLLILAVICISITMKMLIVRSSALVSDDGSIVVESQLDFPLSNPPEYLRSNVAEGPSSRKMLLRHRSYDKSEIGGGVIIGGLISVCLAVVYFYIRATRQRNNAALKEYDLP